MSSNQKEDRLKMQNECKSSHDSIFYSTHIQKLFHPYRAYSNCRRAQIGFCCKIRHFYLRTEKRTVYGWKIDTVKAFRIDIKTSLDEVMLKTMYAERGRNDISGQRKWNIFSFIGLQKFMRSKEF